MSTTIDSLNIEIQSNSTNASQGIKELAKSLGELKANGTVTTAIKNLNSLSMALKNFADASNATRSVGKLVGALSRLKEVGPVGSIGNSLTKLTTSLKSLDNVNIDNVAPKIEQIAQAVAPLSAVKAGGLNTMVNALSKIGKVTQDLDDDKIAAFAERIKKLNDALEPLSTKMTTIQAGLKGINTSARRAGSGAKQMGEDIDAASINMASFIYTVQEAVQWIQAAVQKFSEFIAAAIEWDGIAARFGRGFGPQAQETYEWIQRLNEEMGINIQQFMQYSSIYATMLSGFGVATEDATKMALGYTELTYDIWAGYNDVYKTFEEASEAVKSAIAGEVEPIRRAGFTIIESTLEQTAANHGLEISLANATEAEKSYLRYLTLVDQAHAQSLVGTYAKELNTAEGMMRTFSQQLKSLSQAFGSLFLPILVKVMPYLQAFVMLLTDAVRWFAALFGIKIQAVNFSGIEAGAAAVEEVADSAGGATDALGSAAKAAKELKNATLGIDELNVISPPSTSGSGGGAGGAGGVGGGGSFDSLDIDSLWDESIFDDIKNQVDEIKSKFEAWLPVLGTIAGSLAALGLASFIKNIGDALAEMNVLQKLAASIAILTIEAALVFTFADNYLESGNMLNLIGEALVTAGAGYLMFRAWGVGGAALALGVSIAAQLIALEMSLADGTVSLSSSETWIQGITTILTGALGGLVLSKYTGFFAKEGLVIGMAVTASLVLATMRMGAIESGEIDSGSLEAWLLELGSLITAGLAGKFLAVAFYGAKGGPAGAMIGVTAGLVLNLVATIQTEGANFGDSISDWINAGLTTVMVGLTAKKLWGIVGPGLKTALASLIPMIGGAVTTALGGLGAAITAIGGGWVVAAIAAVVGILALAIADYDFTSIGEKIGEKIGQAFRSVGEFAAKIGGAIWDGLKSAFEWVKDTFDIKDVYDLIDLIFNPVSWFTRLLPKMLEIGGEVLSGLWKGISDGWTNFWGNIGEFIDGFVEGFKKGLGIASPSKVFAEIGEWIIDGLWNGIKNMYKTITSNISNWVKDFISDVKDFFGIGKSKPEFDKIGSSLATGLEKGMGKVTALLDPLKDMWNSAKTWWDKKKGSLKTYTPSIGSIYDKIKERWASAKTWWDKKKGSLKTYTPSIGSIYDKLSVRWKNAKEWWNKKKGSLSYTPSIGSFTDKLKSAWNSAKKWWNNNVKLSIPSLKFKVTYSKPDGKISKAVVNALGLQGWPKLSFAANGGIFDMGSLIWAGERGAEVVANAGGGKTGVMNIQQMQEAVFEGVYAAVMAANRSGGEGGAPAFNIYLDGKQITATVEKRQRERGANLMGNQVYSHA